MSEKILTKEEIDSLLRKLQMKFGAEGAKVQQMIEQDIKRDGFVSYNTAKAQKELSDKILKEKEEYEIK